MKIIIPASLAILTALTLSSEAFAAPINIAPASAGFGGSGLLGFNNTGNSATTGTIYSHAGDPSSLNNNVINTGDHVDTFGQTNTPSLGFAGITFSAPTTFTVTSVNFYGAAFFDGGWFGVNGKGGDGQDDNNASTLDASALSTPTLQISYDYTSANPSLAHWTTVADSNTYVNQLTGLPLPVPFGSPTITPGVSFTLDTPVLGITGIRLIGENGGYSSGGGGFLGASEFQVEATPEPSTWAMMLAGLGVLAFCVRRKSIANKA